MGAGPGGVNSVSTVFGQLVIPCRLVRRASVEIGSTKFFQHNENVVEVVIL